MYLNECINAAAAKVSLHLALGVPPGPRNGLRGLDILQSHSQFSVSSSSAAQSPSTTQDRRQDSSETKTFLLRVQLPPRKGRQRAAPTS